jgi:hypothetical protein
MTTLSFTRRSALRLIAAGFVFRPKIGFSLVGDTDEVNDVHSAVLEHAQKQFEERLEQEHESEIAHFKFYSAYWNERREPEKVNFKLLVVAGKTSCECWMSNINTYTTTLDSAELAEHYRLHHQFQPRLTVSKPYVVAPSEVLDAAYENRRAHPDNDWRFELEYPGSGGTYFQLSPVRFNPERTFAIAVASYRCSAGFIQATRGLWKRIGAHHWEPHDYSDTPSLDDLLDDLGIPGSHDQGLLGRLATAEMIKDLQARRRPRQSKSACLPA